MAPHDKRPVQRVGFSVAASRLQWLLCALIATSLLSASVISYQATRTPRLKRAVPFHSRDSERRVHTGATEDDEEKELAGAMLGVAGDGDNGIPVVAHSGIVAKTGVQELLSRESNYTGIPRIIHQSWKSSSAIPARFGPWMRSWTSAHPTWTYAFWTDADNLALFETLYPQYLHVARGVGKIGLADMARYALLHSVGGLYVDADFECVQPLDKLLCDHELFLSSEPLAHTVLLEKSDSVSLCNALMASKPRHPLWLRLLDTIRAKFERESARDPVGLTGPRSLNQTYFEYVSSDQNATTNTAIVLPPEFFYPEIAYWNIASLENACRSRSDAAAKAACAWLKQFPRGEFTNKTHATHHWQCTWCNGDGANEYSSLESVFKGTKTVPHAPQISKRGDGGGAITFVPMSF